MQIIEGRTQPRRGEIFVANHNIFIIEPRRGEIFVANGQDNKPQPRRGGIIIKLKFRYENLRNQLFWISDFDIRI